MIYQTIIFPFETISKKNNLKVITFKRPGAKRASGSIKPNERYENYKEKTLANIVIGKLAAPMVFPVYAHYFFYRTTRRKFDLGNLSEGPADMMQDALIIPDDDMNHLIPVFSSVYSGWDICKTQPRCVITLTDKSELFKETK